MRAFATRACDRIKNVEHPATSTIVIDIDIIHPIWFALSTLPLETAVCGPRPNHPEELDELKHSEN
jgi:hypothetical protein